MADSGRRGSFDAEDVLWGHWDCSFNRCVTVTASHPYQLDRSSDVHYSVPAPL